MLLGLLVNWTDGLSSVVVGVVGAMVVGCCWSPSALPFPLCQWGGEFVIATNVGESFTFLLQFRLQLSKQLRCVLVFVVVLFWCLTAHMRSEIGNYMNMYNCNSKSNSSSNINGNCNGYIRKLSIIRLSLVCNCSNEKENFVIRKIFSGQTLDCKMAINVLTIQLH